MVVHDAYLNVRGIVVVVSARYLSLLTVVSNYLAQSIDRSIGSIIRTLREKSRFSHPSSVLCEGGNFLMGSRRPSFPVHGPLQPVRSLTELIFGSRAERIGAELRRVEPGPGLGSKSRRTPRAFLLPFSVPCRDRERERESTGQARKAIFVHAS